MDDTTHDHDTGIADRAEELAESAPALTEEQRERLRLLLARRC